MRGYSRRRDGVEGGGGGEGWGGAIRAKKRNIFWYYIVYWEINRRHLYHKSLCNAPLLLDHRKKMTNKRRNAPWLPGLTIKFNFITARPWKYFAVLTFKKKILQDSLWLENFKFGGFFACIFLLTKIFEALWLLSWSYVWHNNTLVHVWLRNDRFSIQALYP